MSRTSDRDVVGHDLELAHRAALVEDLYTDLPPANVIAVGRATVTHQPDK
jgi:hypothetical protein